MVAEFLGQVRPDFWISDRLSAQMGWAVKEQQVCLSHLLRDIQYAIDCGDDAFAPPLKTLLKWAVRMGRRRPDLADTTLAAYHSRLRSKLDELLKIGPPTDAGQKLQRIIKKFRQNLFVFVTNLRRLHRLAVDYARRWTGLAAHRFPRRHHQMVVDRPPEPVVTPAIE